MAPGMLGQVAFRVAVAAYAAGLVLWLTVGTLPILVDSVPAIADVVGTLAAGGGPLAEPAVLLLHPTIPMTGESGNGLLQYAFSLLNLVLGVLLIVRRPNDLVPRLLALGLLGTAATFNLPSHEAFHILGSPWPIALLHFTFHIVSGVAYLWAVALFPDGRPPTRIALSGKTLTVAAVVVTAAVSLICWWSDFLAHPQFFVIFFGILIPVVGVGAQTLRLTDDATAPATRRSARLLIGALLPALALAVIWCLARGVAALDVGVSAAASQAADRLQDLFPAVFAIVPVVLFAGVLRYRLFDIDRLLSRVLVYGLIVIGSGLVYLVAVVTGGAVVGGASWWTVVVLAVAAVALEPAWSLAGRWANRVVFGQDLGPAAAMRTLISGLEQVSSTTELDQLVDVSVRATRAVRAQLWVLPVGSERWSLCATAPGESAGSSPADAPVLVPGRHWPVLHKEVELGVLTVELNAGESLPASERALLADLAAHAGLLVDNAILADQLVDHVRRLTDRANQLAVSRRRLVAALDRERRGIERDLHDGAQQTLVAVMLGMRMAGADGMTAAARSSMLRQLNRELQASRTELAEIAGGQLPVALREGGLQAGLARSAATARRSGLLVDLRVDLSGLGPTDGLPDEVASAVYFCCSEALQNVAKYAGASRVSVEVTAVDGELVFAVTDDGRGFDPARASDAEGGLRGLDDRACMLGGWIAVDATPGGGTRVRGAIPLSGLRAEPARSAAAS
jgi:signal transduction histidine kinase